MPTSASPPSPLPDAERDLPGWLCLLVIIPPLWFAAPLVLTFIAVRVVFFKRGGTPSTAAAIMSFLICLFWVWFLWAISGGAVP